MPALSLPKPYPVFKAALNAIVDEWQVDYARAYPEDLKTFRRRPDPLTFDLAWMTYLSPKFARNVAAPDGMRVERTRDGGLLMIAADETFDTSNPKHMAAAESIRTALAGLNARLEAEYERLWPTRRR